MILFSKAKIENYSLNGTAFLNNFFGIAKLFIKQSSSLKNSSQSESKPPILISDP
jgi:hypothetical protein